MAYPADKCDCGALLDRYPKLCNDCHESFSTYLDRRPPKHQRSSSIKLHSHHESPLGAIHEVARVIAARIEADLNDRSGLGFDGVDQATMAQMRESWVSIVEDALKTVISPA